MKASKNLARAGSQVLPPTLAAVKALRLRQVYVRPSRSVAGVLLARDEYGVVRPFQSPQQVVEWIRRRDRRPARGGEGAITLVDWHGMPAGFEPPAPR